MTKQITDTILMIRPTAFHRNAETAVNNHFQPNSDVISPAEAQEKAVKEFDHFVHVLRAEGVDVIVVEDKENSESPDSIFPNNWNSFHESGRVYLYPMFADNRRKERREDILESLREGFEISEVHSFTHWEAEKKYLEGTGSLILDRPNRIAYAAIADRTHRDVLAEFARETGYRTVTFTANQTVDGSRVPIYHTNVMMCVGEDFAVICADCIDDIQQREEVLSTLKFSEKKIYLISEEQRDQFAGNMLQVRTKGGEKLIVMSQAAFDSLESYQIHALSRHGKLLPVDLTTIETLGGGSARCMMAEIFLPRK